MSNYYFKSKMWVEGKFPGWLIAKNNKYFYYWIWIGKIASYLALIAPEFEVENSSTFSFHLKIQALKWGSDYAESLAPIRLD
jgi:hypothetical protein